MRAKLLKAKRNVPPTAKQTRRLETAIFYYESDTFSASGSRITRNEARKASNKIINNLIANRLDGILISDALDQVRRRS